MELNTKTPEYWWADGTHAHMVVRGNLFSNPCTPCMTLLRAILATNSSRMRA